MAKKNRKRNRAIGATLAEQRRLAELSLRPPPPTIADVAAGELGSAAVVSVSEAEGTLRRREAALQDAAARIQEAAGELEQREQRAPRTRQKKHANEEEADEGEPADGLPRLPDPNRKQSILPVLLAAGALIFVTR